jgi:hypothetical protein
MLKNETAQLEEQLVIAKNQSGAEKAAAFLFDEGDRLLVAEVRNSNASALPRSSAVVSLSVEPYATQLELHRRGLCHERVLPKNGQTFDGLDDALARERSKYSVSCPVPSNGRLHGAVTLTWGRYPSQQEQRQGRLVAQDIARSLAEVYPD